MIPKKKQLDVKHDGLLQIASGLSRKETHWKNQEITWSEFLAKLSTTTRTRETLAKFKNMKKDEQSEIKDVGGFVGGMLKGGRRKAGQVAWRSMLTLDADFAPVDLWETIELLFGNAITLYSTHSHTPDKPRVRLVAPLARKVTADEYKALGRFIAAEIGIDIFDDTTYEPERLMYWPSTSADGDYTFEFMDGPWLDPDDVLGRHAEWQDASTWPESSRAIKTRESHAEKQGDPREKPGIIGAFCRSYTIPEAIDMFLPDVYTLCDVPNRYTYTAGTAAAGVVVYDGELFAFSHHGTDPAGGRLCNAFDLVRIHKFEYQDEDVKADTPVNKLPSYKAMMDWALKDEAIKIELAETRAAEAKDDFGEEMTEEEDKSWKADLAHTDSGGLQQTIHNVVLVLRNDRRVKGCIGYDEFTRRIVLMHSSPWRKVEGISPWVDADDSGLRYYLERVYGLKSREKIQDGTAQVMQENAFHPIRNYLDGIMWDGVPRLDTMLIDYLGAEDTNYVRSAARKWLTAGVARVRDPGCKFDHMLILIGAQGVGKSQFYFRLAKRPSWFSDSLSKFDNTKDSMEQLAGKWVVELGELSVMKKSDVEHVKVFLTKQEDSYRPSYGRRLETFPRQCIFGGTTNRDDFLQDATGNRRFWPVPVTDASRMWAEMTPAIVDQLWAEADVAYTLGEDLYLTGDAAIEAAENQEQFIELGGKIGVADEFLNRLLPENWADMNIKDKCSWLNGYDFDGPDRGVMRRDSISGVELYVECFNGKVDDYKKLDAYEMTDIMRKLGWERQKKEIRIKDYGKQRVFCRQ